MVERKYRKSSNLILGRYRELPSCVHQPIAKSIDPAEVPSKEARKLSFDDAGATETPAGFAGFTPYKERTEKPIFELLLSVAVTVTPERDPAE